MPRSNPRRHPSIRPGQAGFLEDLPLPLAVEFQGLPVSTLCILPGKGELVVILIKPRPVRLQQISVIGVQLIKGSITGSIVTISCEDAYGNIFAETVEVSLTVDEPLPELEEDIPAKKKTSPHIIFLIVLCNLMAAGLVAQHLILTGKIHKLKEDRL